MKTLDEVITIMDGIDQTCTCCAYQHDCDETECIEKTALHYLKEYRTTQTAYVKVMADYEELKNFWAESQANPPLTWNELKTMEGKPVWATFDNENGTWYIAKVYDDEVVLYEWGQEFGERISGAWDYTPKRWQAYRKERE